MPTSQELLSGPARGVLWGKISLNPTLTQNLWSAIQRDALKLKAEESAFLPSLVVASPPHPLTPHMHNRGTARQNRAIGVVATIKVGVVVAGNKELHSQSTTRTANNTPSLFISTGTVIDQGIRVNPLEGDESREGYVHSTGQSSD